MTRDPASFRYESDVSGRVNGRSFYWRFPADIRAKDELMAAFAQALWFPRDFDPGWTELFDSLCDLSEIPDRKVVIVHDALPRLPNDQLKAYLNVLADAVRWRRGDLERQLEIVFPEFERARIAELMRAE